MFNKTFLLEKKYNWDGICIEANPIYYQHLINNRKVKCLNYCVDHENDRTVDFLISGLDSGILFKSRQDLAEYESVIKLKTKRLETILMELNAPKEIDYLSIDVEGAEERILLSFPFSEYKFKCITIERPSKKIKKLLLDNNYIQVKVIPNVDEYYIHHSISDSYRENIYKHYKKL